MHNLFDGLTKGFNCILSKHFLTKKYNVFITAESTWYLQITFVEFSEFGSFWENTIEALRSFA